MHQTVRHAAAATLSSGRRRRPSLLPKSYCALLRSAVLVSGRAVTCLSRVQASEHRPAGRPGPAGSGELRQIAGLVQLKCLKASCDPSRCLNTADPPKSPHPGLWYCQRLEGLPWCAHVILPSFRRVHSTCPWHRTQKVRAECSESTITATRGTGGLRLGHASLSRWLEVFRTKKNGSRCLCTCRKSVITCPSELRRGARLDAGRTQDAHWATRIECGLLW